MLEVVGGDLDEWKEFYPDDNKTMTMHTAEALSKYVVIKAYIYYDHAGNMSNRSLHSGIIIYVNNAPIIWYSKFQNIVEDSRFLPEFVALRITTGMIEYLQYKLRCFGVLVDGPSEIFCENKSADMNLIIPTSILNLIHNAICYHRVRESHASGVLRVGWISGGI